MAHVGAHPAVLEYLAHVLVPGDEPGLFPRRQIHLEHRVLRAQFDVLVRRIERARPRDRVGRKGPAGYLIRHAAMVRWLRPGTGAILSTPATSSVLTLPHGQPERTE